jgi:hypothetical protein
MRLTLRTLLAYLDDTLSPAKAREIGLKVAENPQAQELIDRIKRVTRRRGLATPPAGTEGSASDPNTVAEYLSDTLPADQLAQFEAACLESDVHLAEVAACHQILTLVLSEQVRVPPTARKRMYQLVKGRESIPDRTPGKTIPVGGVLADERPAVDDADAPFLLGLSAYSRADSPGRLASRLAVLGALLLALGVAVWLAIPPGGEPAPVPPTAYAQVPGATPVPAEPNADERPAPKSEKAPDNETAKPTASAQALEQISPPRAVAEATPATPPKAKPVAAKVQPPRTDRVEIGKLEKANAVVVRRQPRVDRWVRVPPDAPAVISADRLVCLPGYKDVLRLDGVSIDLWGNLPELFRGPVLEASITPYFPHDGFHADLAVHAGRIYLTAKRDAGATVRLRFKGQVWDVALAGNTTEVVFELTQMLAPGSNPAPPHAVAALAVLAGKATLRPNAGREPVELAKGGEAYWDSVANRPDVRANPPAQAKESQSAYLSRFQPYFDATRAKLALEALDELARRAAETQSIRAVLDEALQDRPDEPPTAKSVAINRIALLSFAALGDLPALANALTDPNRPWVRSAAVEGLRAALARDPKLAAPFRQVLVEKNGVEDAQADAVLRLLRGLTDVERANPATLDQLREGLSSPALSVRELSFQNLVSFVNPQEKANETLLRFDANAPQEFRDAPLKAWKKKVDELKKELAEPIPSPKKK